MVTFIVEAVMVDAIILLAVIRSAMAVVASKLSMMPTSAVIVDVLISFVAKVEKRAVVVDKFWTAKLVAWALVVLRLVVSTVVAIAVTHAITFASAMSLPATSIVLTAG